jgi:TonB family protein
VTVQSLGRVSAGSQAVPWEFKKKASTLFTMSYRPVSVLLLLAISASLRGADEVDKLVQRRLSPGVVALFARQSQDARIVARLKVALSDEAAPVRTVAARVIALGGIAGLVSDVKEALGRETDVDVASEEIRALCAIGGAAVDLEALAAAKRFAPRLDGVYTRIIGRLRGAGALSFYFSTLREMALSPSDRHAFFRHVVNRDGPEVLAAAGSLALSHRASKDWEAVLAIAAERQAPVKEGVLVAALRGDDAILRGEAAWYMAKTYRQHPPEDSGEILRAVSEETHPEPDAELRFGAEMLRRVLGKPAVQDEGWIACLDTNPNCHLDSDFIESPLVELLTERERVALLRRNETHRPPEARSGLADPARLSRTPAPRATPAKGLEAKLSDLRLVSGLPKGITEDLILVGGCRSSSQTRWYAVAEIEFGGHGLPRHVSLLGGPSKPDCRQTAETIFLMSGAPDDGSLKDGRGVYLAPFEPDCLICNEDGIAPVERAGESTDVIRVRGKVVAPKLVNRVEPLYPVEARRQKQQGIDIYEAVISPTGCVRELRLLKGSYPLLDLTGMEAIARWRYKPATLNGRAVSVYLTVTVTYNLHA